MWALEGIERLMRGMAMSRLTNTYLSYRRVGIGRWDAFRFAWMVALAA